MNVKRVETIDKKEVLIRVERELAKMKAKSVKSKLHPQGVIGGCKDGNATPAVHEKPNLLWRLGYSVNEKLSNQKVRKLLKALANYLEKLIPRTKRYYVLQDFLKYYDEEFLNNAYQIILGRAPDPQGFKEYLAALRSGTLSRVRILGVLRYSLEGKRRKVKIRGLPFQRMMNTIYRLPIVGYILQVIFAIVKFPVIMRNAEKYEAFLGAKFTAYQLGFHELSSNFGTTVTELSDGLLKQCERADQLNEELATKASTEDIDVVKEELATKASTEDMDVVKEELATKASVEDVDVVKEELTTKASAEDVNVVKEELTTKASVEDMDVVKEELAKKVNRVTPEELQKLEEESHVLDTFYLAFEDRFRGSREQIRDRAKAYLPLMRESGAGAENAPIVDVGCGRGEWLELIKENGLYGRGIDLNHAMLDECKARGLHVVESDVIEYFQSLENESVGAITGMHIVEHLPFDNILRLFDEARRVLKPGGVLILETPNPENVMVGACNFYIDPTHIRPIPPLEIQFIAEERGFGKVSIMRLTEGRIGEPPPGTDPLLQQIFYAAPDYALVAYKN